MKAVHQLLLVVVFLAIGFVSCNMTQDNSLTESYNYKRGDELLVNGDLEEALSFFQKELSDNPKNGYAFLRIAAIQMNHEEYGDALPAVNSAIKYIPRKDPGQLSMAYATRGVIYDKLNETDKSLDNYSYAIKLTLGEVSFYKRRSELY